MEDYTIVEKYQHKKKASTIAIRPYFNPSKENMGLEQYGMACLLYTSPSPRDATLSRMPSSA